MSKSPRHAQAGCWAWLLIAVGGLLGIVAGQALRPHCAQAQIPDSGAQRYQMLAELQAINLKMDNIEALMKSGKVVVTMVEKDAEPESQGQR